MFGLKLYFQIGFILFSFGEYADGRIACPNLWITYGNSCYQFSKVQTNWFHAVKNCTDQGGHLVNIETQQENSFLKSTITQLHAHEDTSSINYWTQGNDLAEDGTWIWGYPEGLSFSFTNWAPSEPNNYHHTGVNSEDCMQLWGFQHFQWNDIVCTDNCYFICEIECKSNNYTLRNQLI